MATDWVIETENLCAGYTDQLVLEDVSVRFPAGQVSCIVGGSGCGKSTLLRSIIGLLPPRKGSVSILGQDPYQLDEEDRASLLANVGFMFQNGALLNSIPVLDNLAIPLRAHTKLSDDVIERVVELKLGLVGLGHALHRLPGELSGGMRKRAGLARAIALDPPIVLCDEPSAGLDPVTAANLDELILRLKRMLDMTVIVVTHEVPSILYVADWVVMLHDGGVRFLGTLDEAVASEDPELVTFFGRKSKATSEAGTSLYDALREAEAAA